MVPIAGSTVYENINTGMPDFYRKYLSLVVDFTIKCMICLAYWCRWNVQWNVIFFSTIPCVISLSNRCKLNSYVSIFNMTFIFWGYLSPSSSLDWGVNLLPPNIWSWSHISTESWPHIRIGSWPHVSIVYPLHSNTTPLYGTCTSIDSWSFTVFGSSPCAGIGSWPCAGGWKTPRVIKPWLLCRVRWIIEVQHVQFILITIHC